MAEYASQGVGTAGLVTGIIGSAGWLLNGGLTDFGLGRNGRNGDSDEKPVSRYELSLVQENAILKAQADVDKKLVEVYDAINDKANGMRDAFNAFEKEQLVYNGVNTATIGCMQQNIQALLAMTKMVIPNSSVCPGWGNATVTVSTGTATT